MQAELIELPEPLADAMRKVVDALGNVAQDFNGQPDHVYLDVLTLEAYLRRHEARNTEIPYFGGCPKCRDSDTCWNINRDHWMTCDIHRTKWHVGSNLFSCWREQTEEDWALSRAVLKQYKEVEPVYWNIANEPTSDEQPVAVSGVPGDDIPF